MSPKKRRVAFICCYCDQQAVLDDCVTVVLFDAATNQFKKGFWAHERCFSERLGERGQAAFEATDEEDGPHDIWAPEKVLREQNARKHDYERFRTGTGQLMVGVHKRGTCRGPHCVIHNPSSHHMREWPTHWRHDRRLMERLCPHGVGHPDPDDLAYKAAHLSDEDLAAESVHGCCGCCTRTTSAA